MDATTKFAHLAAANAACIARELSDEPRARNFPLSISNMDVVVEVALCLARFESALPELWEGVVWEDVCSGIAGLLADDQSVGPDQIAGLLGLAGVPAGIR